MRHPCEISSCAQLARSWSASPDACQAAVRSCSIAAGRAERSGRAASLPSRTWRDDAALLKTVSSWLRPCEQSATAVTACVTAARSAPLWASNTARACAACRPGVSAGDATAEGVGEDTAEDVGAVAGAHMNVRAPGIVTNEEPRDTTSL